MLVSLMQQQQLLLLQVNPFCCIIHYVVRSDYRMHHSLYEVLITVVLTPASPAHDQSLTSFLFHVKFVHCTVAHRQLKWIALCCNFVQGPESECGFPKFFSEIICFLFKT